MDTESPIFKANLIKAAPEKDKKCLAVMYKAAGGIACKSAEDAVLVEQQFAEYLAPCEGYPKTEGQRVCVLAQVCRHSDGASGIRNWQPEIN